MKKEEIRKAYKRLRRSLGSEQRVDLSRRLADRSISFLGERHELTKIHLFLPIERLYEVDTRILASRLFELGKEVFTSVTDLQHRVMRTVLLTPETKWNEDSLGIPVPDPVRYLEDENLLDVVFVPLLAFDLVGNRIGYGMGYYDEFLSRLPDSVMRVGLSYFPPEAHLPTEQHDVPLHVCITPEQILYFNE